MLTKEKLNNDNFFKNFKECYIIHLVEEYGDHCTDKLKNKIKQDLKTCCEKNSIKSLPNRNKNYWLIRGWSMEETTLKINDINNLRKKIKITILNKEFWIEKGFTEIESIKKISKIQSERSKKMHKKRKENPENYKPILSPFTEEFWIKKGITNKEEINFKIKSQRKLNVEFWLNRGHNTKESIKLVKNYQSENSKKRQDKWKDKKHLVDYLKQFNTNIEFYLDKGFSIEKSQELLKERQSTFTLEKCIIKHGFKNGTLIFNNRQTKWKEKVFNENTCIANGTSMISEKYIHSVISKINNDKITDLFKYGKDEKFIYDNKLKKCYKYDLTYKKKIVEFHGDFWHCNPKIYNENEIHKVIKLTSKEIWANDKRKKDCAVENNYDIFIIWESEYLHDPVKSIENTIKFLEL